MPTKLGSSATSPVAATGLVALLPSFVGISARVYNDSLAFLSSTAVLAAAVAAAGWFYLRNLSLYGDLTGTAALLDQFGRTPKGSVLELVARPGFWRLQPQR